MLMPKKVKYRKQQRGRMCGKAWRGSTLAFGDYGLKAMECGWITHRQIEAARVPLTRWSKRRGERMDPFFPGQAPTQKPPRHTAWQRPDGPAREWCVFS